MNQNKYILKYLPSLYSELNEIVNYMKNTLKNINAANNLVDDIEKSIKLRVNYPDIFEVYRTNKNGKYNWYRIYVKNFTIFYTIKNNIMIVSHILYSKRDIDKLI